jgi:hypothetical protein
MGCLSKFEKKVCPTDEDSAVAETAARLGTGKREPGDESGIETIHHGNEPHVTPEMEKRLLRKLDRRLIPHIMFLCMRKLSLMAPPSLTSSDMLSYLDRSNIG